MIDAYPSLLIQKVRWIVSIPQATRMTDAQANYLLGKGGYVFGSVGLFVCLFVSNITQPVNRLKWNVMEGSKVVQWRSAELFGGNLYLLRRVNEQYMFRIRKFISLFMLCRKFRHVSELLSKLFNKFGSLFRVSIKFRQSCFSHDPAAGNINPEALAIWEYWCASAKEICTHLNLNSCDKVLTFFISKTDTLREVLMSLEPTAAKMSIPDLDSILKTCTAPMDTMTPVCVEEVTKIIKESSKATCMLDPMSTALVKEIVTHLALYITNIVNMTLSTGIFPSKVKSAIVLPLLKKENLDSESFKNYRPVSNLPFLSKVIEKVMACPLLEHMQANHLLDTLQSAYKEAHSTETALLRVQIWHSHID